MKVKQVLGYDCIATNCNYKLPHYHCKIPNCRIFILVGDGDLREEFNPCCSTDHIKIYNDIYFCNKCRSELIYPGSICYKCVDYNLDAVKDKTLID